MGRLVPMPGTAIGPVPCSFFYVLAPPVGGGRESVPSTRNELGEKRSRRWRSHSLPSLLPSLLAGGRGPFFFFLDRGKGSSPPIVRSLLGWTPLRRLPFGMPYSGVS